MATNRNISLPEELCGKVEKRFGHRFGTLDEFMATVLGQLLREDALIMDTREQQIIEERLKGLGYI
jgi:hypothetical protein